MSKKSMIFEQVRQQAKKITSFGVKSAQKMTKSPVEKFQLGENTARVVEGQAQQRGTFDVEYQDIHQLFRHQFPSLTRQVLGKRYQTINKISHLVLPNGMEQAADELLELLGDFASHLATTENILSATGCKTIQELQKDPERSYRAGNALKEVTKAIAALQGGVSGISGLIGSAIDLPMSVVLSLKTIYEIGRSYGFELDNEEDVQAVYHALAEADLSLIAEKQMIFMALKNIKQVLHTGDYSQLQSFLNSHYSIEQFNFNMTDDDGNYKWAALNVLSKIKLFKYATPLLGGAIGALYNVRLIDEVAEHAHEVFSQARNYLLKHPEQDISVLDAYYRAKSAEPQPLFPVQEVATPTVTSISENSTTPEVKINTKKTVIAESLNIEKTAVDSQQQTVTNTDIETTPKPKPRTPRKRNVSTTAKTTTAKTVVAKPATKQASTPKAPTAKKAKATSGKKSDPQD